MTTPAIALITQARDFFRDNPTMWTTGHYAVDASGESLNLREYQDRAVCHCTVGGLARFTKTFVSGPLIEAVRLISNHLGDPVGTEGTILNWNDNIAKDVNDVVTLLTEVIDSHVHA